MESIQNEEQVNPQSVAEKRTNWGRFLLDLMETLLLAVILFIGINAISARVRVDGFSMRPTLQDGEFVLVNKLSYRFSEIQRGDIIVFHFPMNPEEELIKRVVGLPGDRLNVRDGQVWVNDQVLNEPYIAAPPSYSGEWLVVPDHVFVLGDNRNDSSDSHTWGLLPLDQVVGKAILIYWPPPMWDVIEHVEALALQ